jgi:hypothetical protein
MSSDYVNPFTKEAEEFKRYIRSTNPNEDVEIIPYYYDPNKPDQLQSSLQDSDPDTRIAFFAHHGEDLFGRPAKELGSVLQNTKYKNCYAGSCKFEDIASLPEYSNLHDFYYRPGYQWFGVNPGSNPYKGEEGIKYAMYSTLQDKNTRLKDEEYKKQYKSIVDDFQNKWKDNMFVPGTSTDDYAGDLNPEYTAALNKLTAQTSDISKKQHMLRASINNPVFGTDYKVLNPSGMQPKEALTTKKMGGWLDAYDKAQLGKIVKKGLKSIKKLNPVKVADKVVPQVGGLLNPAVLMGVENVNAMSISPLNWIPGYGQKLQGKGQAFRKFGNDLQHVKDAQVLSPAGGSKMRIGRKQIISEGNWAQPNEVNESYPGVFEATINPQVKGTNLDYKKIHNRNGVLITDAKGQNLPEIPISDPGLSFNRRLPFSNRYIPIDKDKLIKKEFDLARTAPHLQSLAEKGLGAAGVIALHDYIQGDDKRDWYPQIKNYLDKSYNKVSKYVEPYLPKEEDGGGWLDELDDEYRRGGQRRRRGTSKNIQSSINDVFRRNYDIFGPGGKRRYNPRSRYEEGGLLDQYQTRGEKLPESVLAKPAITKEQDSKYDIYKQVSKKPELTIEKKREFTPEEQAYSDKVKARIANPAADIGILPANMVSALTRFQYLTPEEIARVTNNPAETAGLAANLMTQQLLGDVAGYTFSKGLMHAANTLPGLKKTLSNKINDFGEAAVKVKENMQRSPNNPFKKTLSATEMEELKNIRVAGSIADDMNISDIEKIESLLKQDVKDDVLIKLTGQNREELKNQLAGLRNPKSKSKTLSQELEPPLSEIELDMSDLLSDMYSRSRDLSIGDYDIDRVSPMVSTGRRWEQIPITDDPDLNITMRQETNNPYTYSDPNYLTDASRFINERRFREGQTSDYITNIPPVLQRRMVDKVQEYPVINTHGYEPLINSLTKRSTANPAGAMRGAVKTVLGSPKGSKFIPSGSLSSDSYNMSLRAIPSLLDKKAVDVNFLGYNSMNTMGYLTKAGQSPNIIADEMNTIIKKLNKKLPRKEKIPYAVVKDDNVLYPGIGVTRKKMGGWLNKAQDGKEYSDAEANYLNRKAYEESLAQARKDYVNDFVKQGTQDALLNSPFNFIAGITPAGAGIFAAQSALSLGQNVANKEYFDAGLDALFAAPLLKGAKPAVKKVATKVLEKAPWRFKPQKGKIYRQVGKPGFEDAVKEKKVYDKGQKEFLENYPETNYLGEYNEATNAKGLYMKKPSPAPFFSKDQLFFPTNRKATGKGFKKTKNSDAEYLFEGNVPDEALLPRYMDKYLKPGTNSNIFVLRPEYNDLSNFNVYQRDWLRGYKPVKIPKQKMGGWLDKYNNF